MRPPRMATIWLLLLATSLHGGCASAPGIPDTSYFRMPPRTPLPVATTPPLAAPVVIEPFQADGVHSDQALLYSNDPDGERIRAYHYQLWVDPPTRLLQRRLIAAMREARVAPLVASRLPARSERWRIRGQIEAFERVRRADGWHVQVALQLRADFGNEALPRVLADYREERRAAGETIRDSVHAFGAATDAIYARFVAELTAAAAATPVASGAD